MSLFEASSIGTVETRNRGVFRPVRTRFVDDGAPTPDLEAHLAARAAGGAGLVVGPAEMLVHPSTSGPSYIDAYDDAVVEPLSAVTDAVHEAGTPIFGQLTHTGGEEDGEWEMQSQLSASASPSDAAYEMPKPMSVDEIDAVTQGFVTAAENLVAAGFDGVELAVGAFSVLRQFLSPRYNQRDDAYGGDVPSRARFLNEVLAAVSDAVDCPVGVHLSLAELEYGGYEFDDAPDIVNAIEGYDYLSCTVGTRAMLGQTHAGVAVPSPPLVDAIGDVVKQVDVPVMGRAPFTTRETADELLDAGVSFVSFTRQLLADEATLAKYDRDETPTRCIQCNQKCLEGIYGHAHGNHVECVVNPRTGRERDLLPRDEVEPAATEQRVLVVGGGPAGMRFAATATDRGHDVTLREASDSLGGQLRTAAQGVFEPFDRAREDLEHEVRETGVTVELETPVSAETVDHDWDAVVVATGATRPDPPEFEGEVVDAFDVLDGERPSGDVVLVDDNRWVITLQTGLLLLESADDLEMISGDHYPGFKTEQANLPGFVAALQAQGAEFTGNHLVTDVDADGTVELRNTLTGEEDTRTPDTVVYAGRRSADESLYIDLDAVRDDVYRIGDAISPRKLDRAYYDAETLARRL